MTTEIEKAQSSDRWSECEQIYFTGGYGYGLTEDLRNICLGKEKDIKKYFETGEMAKELNPLQRQVLNGISEYRKEEGIGARKTDMVGASDDGTSRSKPKTVRQSTPRKRLALRSSKQKDKNLLRR